MKKVLISMLIFFIFGISLPAKVYADTIEILDWSKVNVGDLNGDGKINAMDALGILEIASYKSPGGNKLSNIVYADINGDLRINANDALIVLKIAAGIDTGIPDISETATIKDMKYQAEKIQLFTKYIKELQLYKSEDDSLYKDSTMNPCYLLSLKDIEIGAEDLMLINESTIVSWFSICDIDEDDNPDLVLIGDNENNLGVNVYVFKADKGELVYSYSTARYKRDNLLYYGTSVHFMKTLTVHPLGDAPTETAQDIYLNN